LEIENPVSHRFGTGTVGVVERGNGFSLRVSAAKKGFSPFGKRERVAQFEAIVVIAVEGDEQSPKANGSRQVLFERTAC
jgi:hypothetical protein